MTIAWLDRPLRRWPVVHDIQSRLDPIQSSLQTSDVIVMPILLDLDAAHVKRICDHLGFQRPDFV
jgi:hypothetical protein